MQSFSELSISPSLKERLSAARFSAPTLVQAAAIPQALGGKDVIATAQTGTGKTLAFLIPVMEKLSAQEAAGIAALVLVPTRELAMQVAAQHDALRCKQTKPAALVVGGLPEGRQLDAIRRGARFVVATPGRLEDYMDRRLVSLAGVKTLVLDEADRMLDMGFLPAIRRIVSVVPKERQTLCFSATMDGAIAQLVRDYTFGSTCGSRHLKRRMARSLNCCPGY
jgi:ATP-dependent RNA helicase RhlE